MLVKKFIQTGLCLMVIAFPLLGWISCNKAGFPIWPESMYRGIMENYTPGSSVVHLAHEGVYVLRVYEYDTIFGRTKMEMYRPEAVFNTRKGKPIDSLFLYFIDDYRFYYSRKPVTEINLSKSPGKNKRIGLYMSYAEENGDMRILLNSTVGKVKERGDFSYAEIYLDRKSAETLTFIKANYPKQIGAGAGVDPDRDVRFFQSDEMVFRAEWHYQPGGIQLKYNDHIVSQIVYNTSGNIREYHTSDGNLITESLKTENRTSF